VKYNNGDTGHVTSLIFKKSFLTFSGVDVETGEKTVRTFFCKEKKIDHLTYAKPKLWSKISGCVLKLRLSLR
jgi:hypothetical protein